MEENKSYRVVPPIYVCRLIVPINWFDSTSINPTDIRVTTGAVALLSCKHTVTNGSFCFLQLGLAGMVTNLALPNWGINPTLW